MIYAKHIAQNRRCWLQIQPVTEIAQAVAAAPACAGGRCVCAQAAAAACANSGNENLEPQPGSCHNW
eukprot:8719519-Karenia_brevis.AAC.1